MEYKAEWWAFEKHFEEAHPKTQSFYRKTLPTLLNCKFNDLKKLLPYSNKEELMLFPRTYFNGIKDFPSKVWKEDYRVNGVLIGDIRILYLIGDQNKKFVIQLKDNECNIFTN